MNRRDFFFAITGGVIGFKGCYEVRPVFPPDRVHRMYLRGQFPPEEILEIDEEGKVHRPLDDPQYMLSYDPKTRTILSVRIEEGPIK